MTCCNKTMLPLLQFIKFVGLDPAVAYGYNPDAPTTTDENGTRPATVDEWGETDCPCYLCSPFNNHTWSRTELVQALTWAEDFFVAESGYYPYQYAIYGESRMKSPKFTTVRPQFPYKTVVAGTPKLHSFGEVAVNIRDGESDNCLDVATFVITVCKDYDFHEIYLAYTAADMERQEAELTPNDFCHFIRPFDSVTRVDNGDGTYTYTIRVKYYLLTRPYLLESDTCLTCTPDNTVEEVEVLGLYYDKCGSVALHTDDSYCSCGTCRTCETTVRTYCGSAVKVRRETWIQLGAVDCTAILDVSGCYTAEFADCPECQCIGKARDVEIDYLTGVKANRLHEMNEADARIICILALWYLSTCKQFCRCEICANDLVDSYLRVPTVLVNDTYGGSTSEFAWQTLVSKEAMSYVDGFKPTVGMIEVMRYLSQNRVLSHKNAAGAIYI